MNKVLQSLENNLQSINFNYDKLEFLAGDASNRKYFKVFKNKIVNILMLDDSGKENIINFINKTIFFQKLGVNVPEIYQSFPESGILIIENFGNKKFSNIIEKKNEEKLYKIAIDSLLFLHKEKASQELDFFDKKTLFFEVELFFKWYLLHKGKKVKQKQIENFNNLFFKLLDEPMKLPVVNIHRDFHVDNLFYLEKETGIKKCGWIDYQDALRGSIVYDLISLVEDARRDITEGMKRKLISYYLSKSKNINKEHFYFSLKIIAIQRHLKVLGIFSRLHIRDRKSGYLSHIPRVTKMLKLNLELNEFERLREIINPLID